MTKPPHHTYLGRVEITRALRAQSEIADAVRAGRGGGMILGFECEPVITLGLRATARDLTAARWPTVRVDRGGQATLHAPGQLVIFPVWPMRDLGSKAWVHRLIEVTRGFARECGHELSWQDHNPGLYDERGKVVSIGLRVRGGVSTHGLSINLRNDLTAFDQIRTCGREGANLAHLRTDLGLDAAFARWVRHFDAACVT